MEAFARDFPPPHAPNHAEAQLRDLLSSCRQADPLGLSDPSFGTAVATARSSWVRRLQGGTFDCHVKTYVYPTRRDRCRGALRNTGPCCQTRAAREAMALRWLREHGFPAPPVLAVAEERRLGFVVRAVLVTATWPGTATDRLLPTLAEADRRRLATGLGAFVAAVHRAGFRDGNLDLRNLLAAPVGERFAIAKIDSPRHRLVAPGPPADRWARADWDRLLPQLAAFGLADIATTAADDWSRAHADRP